MLFILGVPTTEKFSYQQQLSDAKDKFISTDEETVYCRFALSAVIALLLGAFDLLVLADSSSRHSKLLSYEIPGRYSERILLLRDAFLFGRNSLRGVSSSLLTS